MCYSGQMQFISESALIKAIKAGIYAALFLPFFVGPLFFPFATSKGFTFQVLMEFVFALYLFVAFKNPAFRPKKTLIFSALVLYFVALLFSTLLSVDPYRSFFGNYERMWGYFSLAHFFLFFIVCAGIFKTAQEWKRVIIVALCSGALVIAGGAYQFVSALSVGDVAPRISSTIGNAAYLAGYLLFVLLFALFFFFRHRKESGFEKYIYGALALSSVAAILLTATRGALVALGSALVWIVFLSLFVRTKRQVKIGATALLLAVALFAGWLLVYGSLFEKPTRISQSQYYELKNFDAPAGKEQQVGFADRLTKFSLYDPTTQTRLITWRSALSGVKDNPVLGIGPENFALAFNEHFSPDFYTYEKYEIWFDRSHNIFVDTLVTNGIAGLLAYLAIFAVCFYRAFFLYKKGSIGQSHFFLFNAFFVAYLAQNFFLFDSFSVFLGFILVVAYLNSLEQEEEGKQKRYANQHQAYGLTAGVVGIALFAYFFNILPMMESYYIAEAESGRYKIDKAIELYRQAIAYNTFGDNEARSRMALDVAKSVQSVKEQKLPDNLAKHLDEGIKALQENIVQSDPRHLLYRLQLSDLYNLKLSHTGETSSEIEDIIRKSIEISPGRMEFKFALAQVQFLKGDFSGAIATLKEASQKNQLHPMPYWKISQNYYFWSLAEKDPVKAKELVAQGIPYLEKALYLSQDVRNYQELLWAMQYYNDMQDYPKIIYINKRVLAFNPRNALPFHMNLALAYKELGQKDKAREHALQVETIDPSQKPVVDNFMQSL